MSRKAQLIINNISYVPVVNPEIITGVSLMLLFVIVQKMGIGGENGVFGWITLLIAHITFNVPYVIFNVGPKLRQLDGSLYNAALDLGCTPRQAFFKVILPQLSPAIMSAFLICLTYSIDDFMISYFNCGTMQTLPIAIYSMTRKRSARRSTRCLPSYSWSFWQSSLPPTLWIPAPTSVTRRPSAALRPNSKGGKQR